MHFVIYNTADGTITGQGYCQSMSQVNAEDGQGVLEIDDPTINYITGYVANGAIVNYTPDQITAMANSPGDGWVWVPATGWNDTRTLAQAQSQAQARLLAARDALVYSTFTYNGVVYNCGQTDQSNINGAVTLALLAQAQGQPFSIVWTVADGTNVTLDGPSMMGVGVACGTFVQSAFARYRTALASVNAATTNAECDAVVL